MVEVRHAWYIEHKNVLGSCSDFALISALTPKKEKEPDKPSKTWNEYEVAKGLPADLMTKVGPVRDLMELS